MTIEKLEKLRIAYRNKILKGAAIWGVILFIVIIILKDYLKDYPHIIVGGAIMSIGFVTVFTGKAKKAYSDGYKSLFVLNSLKGTFTNLVYEPDKGMPYEVIANTHMMNMGDRYNTNDFISGNYKDVFFSQADVKIEEEHEDTDSDGHTHTEYITIFMGRWMTFDFNKTFKANVQVAQKGFGNNRVKRKGLFAKKNDNSYYKDVKMENEEFNKKFKVYAQSEEEAFYILTPSLMEKIEKLDDDNKGKILLCFIDNRLHIGLYDGKDSFEAPFCFKKIDEQKEIEKTNKDIKVITQFVDQLNLDNTLFKNNINTLQQNMVTQNNQMGYVQQPNMGMQNNQMGYVQQPNMVTQNNQMGYVQQPNMVTPNNQMGYVQQPNMGMQNNQTGYVQQPNMVTPNNQMGYVQQPTNQAINNDQNINY